MFVGGKEQQEGNSSLDQKDPCMNPQLETPWIKQEEELAPWIKQENEEVPCKREEEEVDIIKLIFSPVKSENDVENLQSLQLHHSLTEEIRHSVGSEDCRGPKADPDPYFQPDKTSDSLDCSDSSETSDSVDSVDPSENADSLEMSDPSHSFWTRVGGGGEARILDKKTFSCNECGRRFRSQKFFMQHMRIHAGEKPFSCSVCKKSFAQRATLNEHMKIHTGGKPYICSFCSRAFTHHVSFKCHMKIHTKEKPFRCPVCSKTFSRKDSVKGHMRVHVELSNNNMTFHTGEKPYACPMCSRPFSKYGPMKIHMRAHMRTHMRLYTCCFCHQIFACIELKDKHQIVCEASKADPVDRSHSSKTSDFSDLSDGGQPNIDDVKQFSCSDCGRSFDLINDFKRHIMTHTGEKPYCCSFCSRSFSQKSSLTNHERSHSRLNHYSLPVCGKY